MYVKTEPDPRCPEKQESAVGAEGGAEGGAGWCGRRSRLEKLLLAAVLLLALTTAALAISLGLERGLQAAQPRLERLQRVGAGRGAGVCLSPGCVQTASTLLATIDPTADPCVDFYQFACGNYRPGIPEDRGSVSQFSELGERVAAQVREVLETPQTGVFSLATTVYTACMDQAGLERAGTSPLLDLLTALGGWPVLAGPDWAQLSWQTVIARMAKLGLPTDQLFRYSPALLVSFRGIHLELMLAELEWCRT